MIFIYLFFTTSLKVIKIDFLSRKAKQVLGKYNKIL